MKNTINSLTEKVRNMSRRTMAIALATAPGKSILVQDPENGK